MNLPTENNNAKTQQTWPNPKRAWVMVTILLIAVISDFVLQDTGNIALALSLVCAVILPLSAILMGFALKFYRQSVDDAQVWAEAVA